MSGLGECSSPGHGQVSTAQLVPLFFARCPSVEAAVEGGPHGTPTRAVCIGVSLGRHLARGHRVLVQEGPVELLKLITTFSSVCLSSSMIKRAGLLVPMGDWI